MRKRGILMSAPMVRAILAGTKTQTRRIVKEPGWATPDTMELFDGMPWASDPLQGDRDIPCPYGVPGDRLWVRETWGYRCTAGTKDPGEYMHTIKYRADDSRQTFGPMPIDGVCLPKQRARGACETEDQRQEYLTRYWKQWRPAIFMPRWACRITLEITDVRVERLQEISEADAIAEGIHRCLDGLWSGGAWKHLREPSRYADPCNAYCDLWESINGPGSWDANPWVWALTFRRIGDA